MRTHRSRVGAGVAAAAASLALAALNPHTALAVGPVSVPFDDVRYEEVPCEKGTMSSVGGAVNVRAGVACIKFTARATNPSAKPLNNADVYGRVYDDTGSAVTDVAENNRIAYVDVVPAGTGDVTFVLTMGKNQFDAGPLHWQGLKASGFAGKILPGQVRAGAESASVCLQHHHSNGVIIAQLIKVAGEFVHQFHGQGVQFIGTIQGDPVHPVALLDDYGLVVIHVRSALRTLP